MKPGDVAFGRPVLAFRDEIDCPKCGASLGGQRVRHADNVDLLRIECRSCEYHWWQSADVHLRDRAFYDVEKWVARVLRFGAANDFPGTMPVAAAILAAVARHRR